MGDGQRARMGGRQKERQREKKRQRGRENIVPLAKIFSTVKRIKRTNVGSRKLVFRKAVLSCGHTLVTIVRIALSSMGCKIGKKLE